MAGTDNQPITVTVDGLSVGTFTPIDNEDMVIRPIVSGLAYGTHTVLFQANTSNTNNQGVSDFIIYGPKKPGDTDFRCRFFRVI